MKVFAATCSALAVLALTVLLLPVAAVAGTRPAVVGLSTHHGAYWGGATVVVRGRNFSHVRKVMFGAKAGHDVHVVSSTRLTVVQPEHRYDTVHVRVVTSDGTSSRSAADRFVFVRPTRNTPIQGGLTARQEQRISARMRRAHHGVHTARPSPYWTAAMGITAVRRARSWLGLPYSWAGGNSRGPTTGVCAHNGGDLDCHVVGFDCSGLALYSWAPYEALVHHAETQHHQAGRFHPAMGELVPGDLVFFSGYIPNGTGHVAVYAGHGRVIQAEQSGALVMRSRLVDVIAHSGTYRGATRPLSTGVQGPVPRLSSTTPQLAVTGGRLIVTGRWLGAATSVSVDAQPTYSFARRTATRLVVTAPAHATGRVTLTVSNPWGSTSRTLTYVPAPQVSSLTPDRGPVAGGTTVTITGHNLDTVNRLTVDGQPVTFVLGSRGTLTFTSPAHPGGAVQVTLYSCFGQSNTKRFSYVAAEPDPGPSTPATSSPTAPPARRSSPAPTTTATTSATPTATISGSTTASAPAGNAPSGARSGPS